MCIAADFGELEVHRLETRQVVLRKICSLNELFGIRIIDKGWHGLNCVFHDRFVSFPLIKNMALRCRKSLYKIT